MRILRKGASSAAADRAEALLVDDLVPRLRDALGPTFQPPATITLVGGGGHGAVPATLDRATGAVLDLRDPTIAVDDEHVPFLIVHELGHHHELRLRKVRRTVTGDLVSSVFWTEYFANRTAFACGVGLSYRALTGSGERALDAVMAEPAEPEATVDEASSNGLLGGLGYTSALALAEIHHLGEAWSFRDGDPWIATLGMVPDGVSLLDDLYRSFPRWRPNTARDLPWRVRWILDTLRNPPTG